jgi:8-oxo-dGTP pyrophosphatase MutT (NUDIX family)
MTLREQTRITLFDFNDARTDQIELRDQFLDHLVNHQDALLKSCGPGHITASGLIIDLIQQRVLLTLHPKVGRWLQTGGHCEEGDSSIQDAALREAKEESGIAGLMLLRKTPIRLDAHEIDCRKDGGTIHFDVQFAVISPSDAVAVASDESEDLAWFDVDRLPDGCDSALKKLVSDSMAAIGEIGK